MAFLAENITTAGAKAGVLVTCPTTLKAQGVVAPTDIQFSATDANYVTTGYQFANKAEGGRRIEMIGSFYLRAVVNHVDASTNFDIEIVPDA